MSNIAIYLVIGAGVGIWAYRLAPDPITPRERWARGGLVAVSVLVWPIYLIWETTRPDDSIYQ